MMFFELRQYRTLPGQRDAWVAFMEGVVIPFQVSKGMVIAGTFVAPEEDDLYVWLRRFESEEQRVALYQAVYETDYWREEITPQVTAMLDRSRTVVTRIVATAKSPIQ
jgi:hypothetical protein